MKQLSDLSLELTLNIIYYLDHRSLVRLSATCKKLSTLIKNIVGVHGQIRIVDETPLDAPVSAVLNYRAGSVIGGILYMPLGHKDSLCHTFNIKTGQWSYHTMHLLGNIPVESLISKTAKVGHSIYMFGGRETSSLTLSNGLLVMDTHTFNVRSIDNSTGELPRARHEHSIDVIQDRYLVIFGGLCYNSVGENDIFCYDTQMNHWMSPSITGHIPHMRFGHATAVLGHDLYIHGGAQLGEDGYIVYDDLFRLDCDTWKWYKYEHPEREKQLRSSRLSLPLEQLRNPIARHAPNTPEILLTSGEDPRDRFQAAMIVWHHKLIVFGGHTVRLDDDDEEVLMHYPLDKLCVFNTRLNTWTPVDLQSISDEPIWISEMSIGTRSSRDGLDVWVVGGRLVGSHSQPPVTRPTIHLDDTEYDEDQEHLTSISPNSELRTPNQTEQSNRVAGLFETEPDLASGGKEEQNSEPCVLLLHLAD
ncbi:hypothetical protein F4703DRAFT_1860630 [Phycomyces blakesleeanus]|uniref:F-box domain-containing protein n=1 Tax=Phycomyces blakesleeanus (strain ATCC 8743b / DSM 1359 / FGSC 10004 / NBRC 33097 / NRRL 1555) TaxID=763407 RepID=A0A162UFE2_PHYB8|nr:hypothetical protein PHYBLDRAFT_144110 [Phycomyces blakesleeanus NRRL 1555(-)]OAD74743.1 hypothetical protein PHYBLDRAFT_144110 [Phycomyces blakesleeanus NRRL 1555(-)]|eukprot:XP_018292783.1 hypothetical protein PHYBLDRAFT_144110 [Phycomyces blakesleeanus NRRL 1555(-)]